MATTAGLPDASRAPFRLSGWAVAGCLVLALLLAMSATVRAAENVPIEAFYGSYEGKSGPVGSSELERRDLAVVIKPDKNGFTVTWSTVIHTSDEGERRKSYSIDFHPGRHPGVFVSAMRVNKFGAEVPLDPLRGDPFVWARLEGRTLTVYALTIADDGRYEMQIYERTLADDGLALTFRRFREGEPTQVVHAQLERVR